MRRTTAFLALSLFMASCLLFYFGAKLDQEVGKPIEHASLSGAGQALSQWYYERAYPFEQLSMASFRLASAHHAILKKENARNLDDQWSAIGPPNVGGRTLCLAFHPQDTNVVFAGSASGGLWKSNTQGAGPAAWSYVPTGFPVLGVSSIAIDPIDPEVMFIGTGEVYNALQLAEPGTISRLTRGTYGIGILKSEDGGESWESSLSFERDQLQGVQDIEINPLNPMEVYAATTDGLYKSTNQGQTFTQIHQLSIAVDVAVDPRQDSTLYVSYGNLNFNSNSQVVGIYKSTDAGASFRKLRNGLPAFWSGKAQLAIHPQHSNIIYASIQVLSIPLDNETTPLGLYRSNDRGESWSRQNNVNVSAFQGWYSHDVALNPLDTNELIYVGINAWHSSDAGRTITQVSQWRNWTFGSYPTEGADGPPDYVHADIHRAYFHPLMEERLFLATDGGVYAAASDLQFESYNGGLQTTQFYPSISHSLQDSSLLLGGAQDNATYFRKGDGWSRVVGGDGMSTAIDPTDDQICYASAQGLFLTRSDNQGDSFAIISPTLQSNEFSAFSAPYAIAPSQPNIVYAGGQRLYRSNNRGDRWDLRGTNLVDGGKVISKISVHPENSDVLMIATASNPFSSNQTPKVLRTENGGGTWTTISGLPDRVCKDIVFDPQQPSRIWACFSGFGTEHLFVSDNDGISWQPILSLPDVPTNAIAIDPLNSDHIYIGNDLGVYFSTSAGELWEVWSEGLPDAVLVADLDISPIDRTLRIASHGNGLFSRKLVEAELVSSRDLIKNLLQVSLAPNPVIDQLQIGTTANTDRLKIYILTPLGQIAARKEVHLDDGIGTLAVDEIPPGVNILIALHDGKFGTQKFIKVN